MIKNNIQIGSKAKISNSNISNNAKTQSINHKESMLKQILIGVAIAVIAGVVLWYLGIR